MSVELKTYTAPFTIFLPLQKHVLREQLNTCIAADSMLKGLSVLSIVEKEFKASQSQQRTKALRIAQMIAVVHFQWTDVPANEKNPLITNAVKILALFKRSDIFGVPPQVETPPEDNSTRMGSIARIEDAVSQLEPTGSPLRRTDSFEFHRSGGIPRLAKEPTGSPLRRTDSFTLFQNGESRFANSAPLKRSESSAFTEIDGATGSVEASEPSTVASKKTRTEE